VCGWQQGIYLLRPQVFEVMMRCGRTLEPHEAWAFVLLCRCVEQLRAAGYVRLANEVELAKASKFLSNKEFESAIAVFKVRGQPCCTTCTVAYCTLPMFP